MKLVAEKECFFSFGTGVLLLHSFLLALVGRESGLNITWHHKKVLNSGFISRVIPDKLLHDWILLSVYVPINLYKILLSLIHYNFCVWKKNILK